MSNFIPIGITGRKYSGKDTVAKIITRMQPEYKIRSFAYPLKAGCKEFFQLSDAQLDEEKEIIDPEWEVTPRQLLQFVGTDLFRNQFHKISSIGSKIFLVSFRRWYRANPGPIIVPDIRFDNEADYIRSLNGIIIKIERPGSPMDNHESEQGISKFDYVLMNDCSLADLEKKIAELPLWNRN